MVAQTITKAVAYLRRSTDRQEQSISDQRIAVEKYAAAHGLHIGTFYTDDAISGTTTAGRRAFQQMIEDAQRTGHPFSIIVVYDVKRFGRIDNDEAGYYRHLLRMHGVEVRYVSENFTGDGTDDLLRPVKQWQAREESKDLSKVTIRGLLSKVDGGWWMGGVPPYGYDLRYQDAAGKFLFVLRYLPDRTKIIFDRNGDHVRTLGRCETLNISKRDRAKLTLSDPERVKVIKEIFRSYVNEGRGFKAIAEALNRRNVPTPRGPSWTSSYSGQWTETTIRSILTNPIYTGDMVWNRRTLGRFHKISARAATPRRAVGMTKVALNGRADWIVIKEAHPPIVDRILFEAARVDRESRPTAAEQLGVPRPRGGWHGIRSRFVLSGLLYCARCGGRYQGLRKAKGKRRGDGMRAKTCHYVCAGYIKKGLRVCKPGFIRQEVLERAVIDTVQKFYVRYLAPDGKKALVLAIENASGVEEREQKPHSQAKANVLVHEAPPGGSPTKIMGLRGPRPTPSAILKARGTYRADRARHEVKGPGGVPRCPAGLDKQAKQCWGQLLPMLESMGVLSRIDRNAIIRYCIDWSRWHQADQFLAKNGMVYPIRDGNGKTKCVAAFPQVAIVSKLGQSLMKFEQEFGMTPSARMRIDCSDVEDEEETVEEYLSKRDKQERYFKKKTTGTSAGEVLKLLRDSQPLPELKIDRRGEPRSAQPADESELD